MTSNPLIGSGDGYSVLDGLRAVLRDVLGLSSDRVADLGLDSELFGAMPELDSMAVAAVLTDIEDRFGIIVDDDDIDGDTFATLGSLADFVSGKLAG